MKAKMPVVVRIKLGELISRESGDFVTLKMYREFLEELSLSEKEQILIGYVNEETADGKRMHGLKYPGKDPMKEIHVGEIITSVVCKKLKQLNDQAALTPDMFDLYSMFKPEIDKLK